MVHNNIKENMLAHARGKVFTTQQASNLQKELDKFPTNHPIEWVSVKTGNKVAIG